MMHNLFIFKKGKEKMLPYFPIKPQLKRKQQEFFKNYFMFKSKSVLQLFTYSMYLSNFILLMGKSTLGCSTFQHVVEFILVIKMIKITL
jgi:vacuolar-type H+-ATPase subunit C/Vma6